jgi:hypothetical protein
MGFEALSRRSDLGIVIVGARTARAAARGADGIVAVAGRDGGREAVERYARFAGILTIAFVAVAAGALAAGTIFAVARLVPWLTILPFEALCALGTLGALFTLLLTVILIAVVGGIHRLVLIVILIGLIIVAAGTLLFVAGAAFVQDAEIMVRELKIIFGLDTVAAKLGVARKRFVLLMKLARIPTRAVLLAVAWGRRIIRRAGSAATTASAAVLAIVDQTLVLVIGGRM